MHILFSVLINLLIFSTVFGDEPSLKQPSAKGYLLGLSNYDFVNQSEEMLKDGVKDHQFRILLDQFGGMEIDWLEIRNVRGQPSVWDTIPRNQKWLVVVINSGEIMNQSDGTLNVTIPEGLVILDLLVQDNGSIRAGKTNYVINIFFKNGQYVTIPVEKAFDSNF